MLENRVLCQFVEAPCKNSGSDPFYASIVCSETNRDIELKRFIVSHLRYKTAYTAYTAGQHQTSDTDTDCVKYIDIKAVERHDKSPTAGGGPMLRVIFDIR